jgi:hypothetical protein
VRPHPAVVALARVVNEMTDVLEVLWAYTSEPPSPAADILHHSEKALKETREDGEQA